MYRLKTDLTKLENNQLAIPAELALIQSALAYPDSISVAEAQLLWHSTPIKTFRNTLAAQYIQDQWPIYNELVANVTYQQTNLSQFDRLPDDWHVDLSAQEIGETIAASNELALATLFWQYFSTAPVTDYDLAFAQIMDFGIKFHQFGSSLPDWVKTSPRAAFLIRAVRTARVAVFGLPNLISMFNQTNHRHLTAEQLRTAFTRTSHKSINPMLRVTFPFIDQLKEYITTNNGIELNPQAFDDEGENENYHLVIKPEVIEQVHVDLANWEELPIVTGCPVIAGHVTTETGQISLPVMMERSAMDQFDRVNYWAKAVQD